MSVDDSHNNILFIGVDGFNDADSSLAFLQIFMSLHHL